MENSAINSNQAVSTIEAPRVRKESTSSAITVDNVADGNFKKEGQQQAQLRQEVTTISYYPSKKISNDKQDNVFGPSDFGDSHKEQAFPNKETRVAWLAVPEGLTPEQVAAKIAAHPKARLYKVLANKPILTEDQQYAVTSGLRTYDEFANSQVARYPKNPDTEKAGTAGKLVLDPAGKVQYRAVYFSSQGAEDKDYRTSEPTDFYASAEIKSELANQVHVEPEQVL